jgi:hypothetical protein
MFWTFGFVQNSPTLITDFGFSHPCAFLVINCFMNVYSRLVQPIVGVVMNKMTRSLEFSADKYVDDERERGRESRGERGLPL